MDKLIVEVGTGSGEWAHEMALQKGAFVYAFEPSTAMRRLAFDRLCELPNARLIPYAVGGSDRAAMLYRCDGPQATLHGTGEPHEGATVVSMNHVFVTFRIAEIDVLRLDCNGSEYEILEQMIDTNRLCQVKRLEIVWNGNETTRKQRLCVAIALTHQPPDGGACWERKP